MNEKESPSTWRRVWLITAIIISILVLLIAAGGIAGTWFGRGVAINVNDSLMEAVDRLAGAGRQGVTQLSDGVDEIRVLVGEVESAVDEVSQNITDKGLVMTLLPQEKEEKILTTAENVGETLDSITSAVETAFDLYKAIDDIPLVDLPKPEEAKVQTLNENVAEIQDNVDQFATDVQQFRDDAASKVDEISERIGEINNQLETTSQNLSALNSELADLQTRANDWQGRFRTISAITSLFVTLLLIWIIYAMVNLIKQYWTEWKS
jgi:uncharacterized phage infection (PIP) family protein YhgE